MLNDNFEDDATLCELKPNVLTCWGDLAELGHCVESLLWGNHYAPLTSVLLLQQLDQHVRRIVREALCTDCSDDVVLAEVFEVLRRVLSSLDPERVILRRFALVRYVSVEQA